MSPGLTIAQLNRLGPCPDDARRVQRLLRKFNADPAHCFTAAEAREAGCSFDDVLWAAGKLARNGDNAIERRLRLFAADCAAHVLGFYEQRYPTDGRPRKAIKAARDYANGKISFMTMAAAYAAARTAARAAEQQWQFDRLLQWLSDDEPKPLKLPARPKAEARREAA